MPAVHCPHCQGLVEQAVEIAGEHIACPHCRLAFVMPPFLEETSPRSYAPGRPPRRRTSQSLPIYLGAAGLALVVLAAGVWAAMGGVPALAIVEARIDGSSLEAGKESIARVRNTLPKTEHPRFERALRLVSLSRVKIELGGSAPGAVERAMLEAIDGMSAAEVIEKGDLLHAKRIKKATEEVAEKRRIRDALKAKPERTIQEAIDLRYAEGSLGMAEVTLEAIKKQ